MEEQTPINQEYISAESDYKREVLVTSAQPLLKKVFFAIWGLVDVMLILAFVLSVVVYLVYGSFQEKRQVAAIANNIVTQNNISSSRSASAIEFDTPKIFTLGEGRYDFYTKVTNPNTDWYAEFEYYFETNNGNTEVKKGFLLPGDVRLISSFNQTFTTRPSNPVFVVQGLSWKRVDHHNIPDIDSWMQDHEAFLVTNAVYGFDVAVDGTNIARSSFDITNNTPFAYWEAVFSVALTRGGTIVGVNQVVLQGLESGETRHVDVNWFSGAPTADEVSVESQINYFDDTVYMNVNSSAVEDVRDRLK
ncbi:hypothetical protein CO173_01570 [Candidatus Uhrbacteria bacterium CG_4_9_14_3_um_filter_41_35]|uniref:Uncharacterized protein n=1 Tax=Candidatus Uhrbacteria bacterium CG_4_9_14_3_um_filter_41_35 TaxID=1975034 RepID=A0A2M7XFX6_9BACT|nr:MAG: hypothetical protein CO173_01570 [Candidatus Uhrbacteria bacterium CG_4_9_14_3_um_filter_41_35]